MAKKDAWEMVKEKLIEKHIDPSVVYTCIAEVAEERGVNYIKL